MNYKKIKVDFLLNKITKKDNLFNGNYTVDPYQNCEFGCLYCDSAFDKTIKIKINAPEILDKELEKEKKGTIILGSVHDPYQNAEKKYNITKNILKIINKHNFSCHILTKSDLILRDLNFFSKMNNIRITISLISFKNNIINLFEKNLPGSNTRLKIIEKLVNNQIKAGIALIPIIPYITDNEIDEIVKVSKKYKAKYLIYKHLELKGDQKQYFFDILNNYFPNMLKKYDLLYKDSYNPKESYILELTKKINNICKKYKIKNRI